ncbi:Tau-tubulin kinase 2 [Aphelenchoides besseyi]|nr:Tau-tubulin kinase 2 [Aphelenchoides besseyi]KAI6202177.1 Tau-tubulin kinase 2 [Aphelenchoides besseyi]
MDAAGVVPAAINFDEGKIVSNRWRIEKRLGIGAYGVVYQVADLSRSNSMAALKVEVNGQEEGGMLKIEAEVLKRLETRPNTIRLFQAGKRPEYSFLAITLCGADLVKLRETHKLSKFSESTTLRIGVHCLYSIKQLHECGYVHRDIKPANCLLGSTDFDSRMFYIVDFGMVRQYAYWDTKRWTTRRPRKRVSRNHRKLKILQVLLRGTPLYCSTNVHKRMEQGRVDDLWSLVYTLIELRAGLPWAKVEREDLMLVRKENYDEGKHLKDELSALIEIIRHLKTLGYLDRPDYKFIYDTLMKSIRDKQIRFTDNYDWEKEIVSRPLEQQQVDIANLEVKTPPLSPNDDAAANLLIAKGTLTAAENIDSKSVDKNQDQQATEQTNHELHSAQLTTLDPNPKPPPNSTASDQKDTKEQNSAHHREIRRIKKLTDPKQIEEAEEKLYPTIAAHHYDPQPFDVPSGTVVSGSSTRRRAHS